MVRYCWAPRPLPSSSEYGPHIVRARVRARVRACVRACVRARAHVRARVHACVRGRSVRGVPFCSWRRACTAWTAWSSCTPRELYHTSYYLLVIADQL